MAFLRRQTLLYSAIAVMEPYATLTLRGMGQVSSRGQVKERVRIKQRTVNKALHYMVGLATNPASRKANVRRRARGYIYIERERKRERKRERDSIIRERAQ